MTKGPAGGDLVAGASVALVLIPQSMAYAEIAGVSPIHGVYAAVAAPLAGALVGSSPYLQTGPAPVTSLLTFGALVVLADPFSPEFAVLAGALAILVGLVRLALGLLGGGPIAYLMSTPVVVSFTFAAAVIIIASQVPSLLGVAGHDANPVSGALQALAHPSDWSGVDVAIGLLAFAVMVLGRKLTPLFPGALVVVLGATAWSSWWGYQGNVVGDISVALSAPDLPPVGELGSLLLPAAVIAIVGFAEPAAIARRYAAEDRVPWNPNRELTGQGLANVAAGVVSGYPVGGSFSRTALNRLSGARTRWSGAVTGVVVLAFLPFVDLLAPLPKPALAGIVIAVVASLIDVRTLATYWRWSRPQFAVAMVTLGSTLVLAPRVDRGVLIGIAAATAVHLWREAHVTVGSKLVGDTLHLWPAGVLFFGSAAAMERLVTEQVAAHQEIRRTSIHLGRLGRLDLTGALMLRDVIEDVQATGVRVEVVGGGTRSARLLGRVLASGEVDDGCHPSGGRGVPGM